MMTARRHFPLHNNEPELIDYIVSVCAQRMGKLLAEKDEHGR